jgi:hypothetical protein
MKLRIKPRKRSTGSSHSVQQSIAELQDLKAKVDGSLRLAGRPRFPCDQLITDQITQDT